MKNTKKGLVVSILSIILIIFIGIYYFIEKNSKPISGYPPIPGQSFTGNVTKTVGLDSAEQKYWGQAILLSGINNYSDKDDKVEIAVNTYSAKPPIGSKYGVGIYEGSCGIGNKIKFLLPNLVIDNKGTKSISIFDISQDELLRDGPMSIRVSDNAGVIACGNIL